jgi:hypothetical protein
VRLRLLSLLAVGLCGLCAPAAAPAAAQEPDPVAAFDGSGMWIWQLAETEGGDVERIVGRARAAGLSFVVVKAAHGTQAWPQFSRALVDALHAGGLRVCAYQRALARAPGREARTLARASTLGADCLVIDAESEYEGRFAQARTYVRALRAAVGDAFPVGLTSFPFADVHPRFPYRVFLGPGGAQVNLPQMYWGLIGTTVAETFRRTWATNAAFGRPIRPIGQLFGRTRPAAVDAFERMAAERGAAGVSWWAWQHARPQDWAAVRTAALPPLPVPPAVPAPGPLPQPWSSSSSEVVPPSSE